MVRLLAVFFLIASIPFARAEEPPSPWVRFTSLDSANTVLNAYLFRAPSLPGVKGGRHPAVVFMDGCGGLMTKRGGINARALAWKDVLNEAGYTVLMVDSFTTRGVQNMCSPSHFEASVVEARPYDAYAALLYLQNQSDIMADHIALMGWSEGGGATLGTIRQGIRARPANLPQGDYRAAIAFYPARCNLRQQGAWMSTIPLLVLSGLADVWTPATPCRAFIESVVRNHGQADIVIYPDAVHDFDWPGRAIVRRLDYTTREGIVPIEGENPQAREDALHRVPEFLARAMSDR